MSSLCRCDLHRFALTCLPVVLAQCGPSGDPLPSLQMPPSSVTLEAVEKKPVVEWAQFTGRVEAMETVELRPRVSGYLTEVLFDAGELVERGQHLFTIDRRSFETELAQAAAALRGAEVQAKVTEKEYERVKQLLEAKALSPEQADAREAAFLQAKAQLAGAEAAHRAAEIQLSHAEVRAPITGRISRALVTEGNYVSGSPGGATLLTTIVTVDPVYVYADVDENSLLKLQALRKKGQLLTNAEGRVPVKMQLSGEEGYSHEGYVESFDNRLDVNTGTIVVRAQFGDPEGELTPGLFARLMVPMTAEYEALLIDDSAVLTDQASKYVLTVSPESTSQYRPVVLGPVHEGKRIVRSGLEAGEKIIVNGQGRLPMPGMPVSALEASETKPAAETAVVRPQ